MIRRAETAAALGGCLCLAGVFAFLVTPGLGRGRGLPRGPREATGWLDPTECPAVRGGLPPKVDPATLLDPDPAALAEARRTYDRLCAGCHGPAGRGDGPAGRGLAPPPRDFTQTGGWKHGADLAGILRTLEEGVPGTAMAPYRHLGRKARVALARVVMGLGPFDHGPEDRATLLRAFQAPEGRLPNLIPVSRAMARLAAEAAPPPPLPRAPAWAVADPARAAAALAAHPGARASDTALLGAVAAQVQDNGFTPAVLVASPERRRRFLQELP
ncbi:c-type cytochrome [Mesoterricola sediminis]|uniref:Cytochrome c domain-containing protein n=1 Tax=Mesoterricola sediminis TaxID=2927980 RepID=A0AA48KBH3_9BACT|nr:cytochrome c [Mesoterricola sediminis]BDU75831.1 hypothetical protein METESE_07890 [Mesoterricola sediminis]